MDAKGRKAATILEQVQTFDSINKLESRLYSMSMLNKNKFNMNTDLSEHKKLFTLWIKTKQVVMNAIFDLGVRRN